MYGGRAELAREISRLYGTPAPAVVPPTTPGTASPGIGAVTAPPPISVPSMTSVPPPLSIFPSGASGGDVNTTVTTNDSYHIDVRGTSDPQSAARAVRDSLSQLSGDKAAMLRNSTMPAR